MDPAVRALRPPTDVPAEEAALDGALAHLREVIGVLDLTRLDRLSGDGVLSVLSMTASLARGIESILRPSPSRLPSSW